MIAWLQRYTTRSAWLIRYFLLAGLVFTLFLAIRFVTTVARVGLDAGLQVSRFELVLALLIAVSAAHLLMMHFGTMALLHESLQMLNAVAAGDYKQPAGEPGPFVPGELAELYRVCRRVADRQRDRALLLQRVTMAIRSSLDLQDILDQTGREVKQAFGDVSVLVWPAHADLFTPLLERRCGGCPVDRPRPQPWQALGAFFARFERPGGGPLISTLRDRSPELQFLSQNICRGISGFIAFPLDYRGEALGWLLVASCGPNLDWPEEDVQLLHDIAAQLSTAVYQGLQYHRIRELNARLTEVDRFKTDLIDAISHDLRSPLTSILGFVATLLRPEAHWDEATHKRLLKIVYRQSKRLTGLVDDLLTVPTLDKPDQLSLDLEPLDLAAVVNGLIPLYERCTDIELAPDLPPVLADRRRLEQVIMNLLDNACKYAHPGAPVAVATRAVPGGSVALRVTNPCEPIPPEAIGQLFDKFRRLNTGPANGRQGSGLGLYIARGLTAAMRGRIGATCEDGCFRIEITLPAAAGGLTERTCLERLQPQTEIRAVLATTQGVKDP